MRHLCGLTLFGLCGIAYGTDAFAAEPTKPIRECAQEFHVRELSLEAQGVSPAVFFHECWWHSHPGQRTELAVPGRAGSGSTKSASDIAGHMRLAKTRVANATATTVEGRRQRMVERSHAMRKVARIWTRAKTVAALSRLRSRGPATASRQRLAFRQIAYATRRTPRADWAAAANPGMVPANAIDGRRAWIGTATADGARKMLAVIIGPLTEAAIKGSELHCWNQDVLFVSRRVRWKQSLVCKGQSERGEQKIWFETFR